MILEFIKDKRMAPLYRLPRSAFEKCYPELLADGALREGESKKLMAFFNEIETLNRGFDFASNASSDPAECQRQYDRNLLKANRLKPGGELYDAAIAIIGKHI
jgi:hypothetical protein